MHQQLLGLTPEEVLDYLRKSQSDDPLLTVAEVLAKHEAILDEWAEKHLGGKVPEENKFREVVSGETIKERPEINKVLRLIESPKIKAVKVVEPQRLTRGDLEDIGRLMKLFKLTNTLVITPERTYDLRDEYDWDAFERELMRGNDFLKYTKKILSRGRLLSVSQGNYLGSIPPYGFDKTVVKDGKRECPTLKENKAQADVVRMIFDMYVTQDMGQCAICNRLEELGIKPPKGKHWKTGTIRDILANVHYDGKVKWNWRKTVSVVEEGEILKTRPKAKIGEYLIFEGRHERLVSKEIFAAAREKAGRYHRTNSRVKFRNPLAGVVYCQCGRAMIYKHAKNKDGTEQSPPRLVCPDQHYCKTGSCAYKEMIDRVCEILRECIDDFEVRIKNDTGNSVKLHAELIKNLEKRLEELKARELSQWKSQSDPNPDVRMPPEIFKYLNAELLAEKDEVQKALCKARDTMPEPINYEERRLRFQDALEALQDPSADPQAQNRLLKACFERIDYHRDKPTRTKTGKGTFPMTASTWTNPPIELDVKLRV